MVHIRRAILTVFFLALVGMGSSKKHDVTGILPVFTYPLNQQTGNNIKTPCSVKLTTEKGKTKAEVTCEGLSRIPSVSELRHLTGPYPIAVLNLESLDIDILKNNSFISYEKLERLLINHKEISLVESDAFLGLKQLRLLSLTQDNIDIQMTIMPQAFAPIQNLNKVIAHHTNIDITNIGEVFCGASGNLTYISLNGALRHKYISGITIDSDFSRCISNVTHLYLERNKIARVTAGFALNLQQIQYLSLRDNQIVGDRNVLFFIPILKHLVKLDIGCQHISKDCNPTLPPPGLHPTLNWRKFVTGNPNTSNLVKPNKTQATVVIDLFLPNLSVLVIDQLGYHPINVDGQKYWVKLRGLQFLDVGGSRLKNLNGTLCCAFLLKYLNLRDNHLRYVDDRSFCKMPNLQMLLMNKSVSSEVFQNKMSDRLFARNPHLIYLELTYLNIHNLPDQIFRFQKKMRWLLLQGNKINNTNRHFQWLDSIEYIDLRDNEFLYISHIGLDTLRAIQKRRNTGSQIELNLLHNPIKCSCDVLKDLYFLVMCELNITGLHSHAQPLTCTGEDGKTHVLMKETMRLTNHCAKMKMEDTIAFALFVTVLLLITILNLIYRFKWQIQYHLTMVKYLITLNQEGARENAEFMFDAFVSYSSKDEDFVDKFIVRPLEEDKTRPYRLCLHYRHFRPGFPITANILDAISKSRTTIVCVSKHFIRSGWCELEAQLSHAHSLNSRHSRLVAVVHPYVQMLCMKNSKMLQPGLSAMIRSVSYLDWPIKPHMIASFKMRLKSSLGTPLETYMRSPDQTNMLLLSGKTQ